MDSSVSVPDDERGEGWVPRGMISHLSVRVMDCCAGETTACRNLVPLCLACVMPNTLYCSWSITEV